MPDDDRSNRRTNPDPGKPRQPETPVFGYPRGKLPSRPELELKAPVAIRPQRVLDVPPESDVERSKRLATEAFERRRQSPPPNAPAGSAGAQPPPPPSSVHPLDPVVGKAVRKASWRFLVWLAPLVGAGLLTLGRQALELWQDVQKLKTEAAELRAENRTLREELTAVKAKQAAGDEYDSKLLPWFLGVLEKQGVRARRPAGVEPTDVDVTIPLRRPGEIKRGPVLEVLDAPPTPPPPQGVSP